jgi:hypothetical protein
LCCRSEELREMAVAMVAAVVVMRGTEKREQDGRE